MDADVVPLERGDLGHASISQHFGDDPVTISPTRLAALGSRSWRRGARLVGEGAAGYTFFILVDGTAEVTQDERALAALGPGDFFGEIAILGEGRRTATVTSTSPARLLVLFGTEFRLEAAAHPDIASSIAETIRSRLAGRVSKPA